MELFIATDTASVQLFFHVSIPHVLCFISTGDPLTDSPAYVREIINCSYMCHLVTKVETIYSNTFTKKSSWFCQSIFMYLKQIACQGVDLIWPTWTASSGGLLWNSTEPSGSIKDIEFLQQLSDHQLLRLCSTKFKLMNILKNCHYNVTFNYEDMWR
jgi:hypothetical protein